MIKNFIFDHGNIPEKPHNFLTELIPKAFATSHTEFIRVIGYVDFSHLDYGTSIPDGTVACLFDIYANGSRNLLKHGDSDACYIIRSDGFYGPYATINSNQDYNIHVSISLTNDVVEMRKSDGIIRLNTIHDIGYTVDNFNLYEHNFIYEQTEEMNNTIQAYLWLNEGHSYVKNTFSENIKKVSVYTHIDENAQYYGTISLYYDTYLKNKFTVLHEYGHHVFSSIYDGNTPLRNCPETHYIKSGIDLGCAYTEGLANVFAFLVSDVTVMKMHGSIQTYIDIENTEWYVEPFDVLPIPFEGGSLVEGNVAGMFWDIADSNDDFSSQTGVDLIDNRIRDAFTIIKASQPTDHIDFASMWNGYIPHVTYSEAQTNLDRIFVLNRMGNNVPDNPLSEDKTEIFYDRMDTLTNWIHQDYTWFEHGSFTTANKYQYPACDSSCDLVLADNIDLSRYDDVELDFRYVDRETVPENERRGEKQPYQTHSPGSLNVHGYDGRTWSNLGTLYSETYWKSKTIKIPDELLVEDFSIRFTFRNDLSARHHVSVSLADVRLTGIIPSNTNDDNNNNYNYIIKEITKLAEILWNSNSPWTDESVINQYGVMDEVLEASDCDNECELVTIQSVNLTEYDNANLNLWYYLSSKIDAYQNEGLRIEVSNVSNSWHEIAFFDDVNTDSSTWTEMNMNLDEYSSSENFNVRVTAISSKSDEIIRINDANITGTETIEIKIKAKNVTIFQDHADTFQEWDRSGEDWLITNTTNQNNVNDTVFHAVDCDQDCILVMKNGLNMTPYEKVHLNFSYHMTNVDDYNDEGLKIEANDGNGSWQQVANYTERHNNEERFGIEWSSDNRPHA